MKREYSANLSPAMSILGPNFAYAAALDLYFFISSAFLCMRAAFAYIRKDTFPSLDSLTARYPSNASNAVAIIKIDTVTKALYFIRIR